MRDKQERKEEERKSSNDRDSHLFYAAKKRTERPGLDETRANGRKKKKKQNKTCEMENERKRRFSKKVKEGRVRKSR